MNKYLQNILVQYGSQYCQNFDKDLINIQLVKGLIEIKDVVLKPTALQALHPGIEVGHGYVRHVQLTTNLLSIKKRPFILSLEGIELVLKPRPNVRLTEQEIEALLKERFMAKINKILLVQELAEDQGDGEGENQKKKKKKDSGFKQYVFKRLQQILQNLKVNLSEIHIRYEDPKTPAAMGLALKRLSIISVDQNGQETFFKEKDTQIFKKIDIEQFQLYCNNQYITVLEKEIQGKVVPRSREEVTIVLNSIFYQRFQDPASINESINEQLSQTGAAGDPYPPNLRMETPFYMIHPMSVSVVIVYNQVPAQMYPKFGAKIQISNLNFSFSSSQLLSILQVIQGLQQHQLNRQNVFVKPEAEYETDPTSWMRYAFITQQQPLQLDKQILQDNEYRDYMALYAQHYINSRTKQGKNIISSFEKKSNDIKLPFSSNIPIICNTEEQSQQMHLLHQVMDDSDILTCRFIVNEILKDQNYEQLKQQNYQWHIDEVTYQTLLTQNKQMSIRQQIQDAEKDQDFHIKFELSVELDKFQLIFNSVVKKNKQQHKVESQQQLSDSQMSDGTISKIAKSIPLGQPYRIQPLTQFSIIQVQTKLTLFASGDMVVQGDLVDIEVYNEMENDIKYPVIFRKCQENPTDTVMNMKQIEIKHQSQDKFINFQFSQFKEKNITAFNLHIDPMLLVISNDMFAIAAAIRRELTQFNEFADNNSIIKDIKAFSGEQWKKLKQYSEKSINEIVANHKEIDLFINISSPIIVIPADVDNQDAFIVVNFGKLRIRSDNQQQALTVHSTGSEASQQPKENNIYDIYEVLFTDTSIFVSKDTDEIVQLLQLYQQYEGRELENNLLNYSNNIILQPTNVQIQLYQCFVKNYVDAPQMKAHINLGHIGIFVSEMNLILLLKVVNYFTSHGLLELRESQMNSSVYETLKTAETNKTVAKSRLQQRNAAISAAVDTNQCDVECSNETETSTTGTDTIAYLDELQKQLSIQQICKYTRLLVTAQLDVFQIYIFAQSIRTYKNEQLVIGRLENAYLIYEDHPYHKGLQVRLSNLSVLDNVKKLDFINSKFEKDLFTMTATRMNKKHPDYAGIKTHVSVALQGLNIFYDPFFIHDIMFLINVHMELFKELQRQMEEQKTQNLEKMLKIHQQQYIQNTQSININQNQTATLHSKSSESSLNLSQLEEYDTELYEKAIYYFIDKQSKYQQTVPNIERKFSLNVEVDELNLHLCKINTIDSFVQTKLRKTTLNMAQFQYYYTFLVETQGIEIFDNYQNTKYNYFIRMPDAIHQNDIKIMVTIIDPRSKYFQGYSLELNVEINVQLQVTIMYRFIQQVREYLILDIQDNAFSHAINEKLQKMKSNIQESIYNALNYKKQQRKPPSFMRLTVNAMAPAIRVPVNDMGDLCFSLDLGRLTIEQKYSVGVQDGYIDNIQYSKIPVNQMIIKLQDVSINLIKHSETEQNSYPTFHENQYLFAPNDITVVLYTLVESNETVKQQLSGKLPSIALHFQVDKNIETQIDTHTYDTILSLMHCQNNFGFNIVDQCNYTNADLIKVKNEIAEIKSRLKQHASREQVDKIIKKMFSLRDQQAITTLHTLESKVVQSGNEIEISTPSIENPNVMTLAISVVIQQLRITLSGGRDVGQHPISSTSEAIALTGSGFKIQFNKYTLKQDVNLQLQSFNIQDLRIMQTSQRFSQIINTDQSVILSYSEDNKQQSIEITCPSVIQCNLVFETIRYLSSYFIPPYDSQNVKTKQIRQKKLQLKSKYELLNKSLSIYKQIILQVEKNLGNTSVQFVDKISSTEIIAKVALMNEKPSKTQRYINISLPCFNVYVPENINDDDAKILLATLQLNAEIQQKIVIQQQLSENQNKTILDVYNRSTTTSITANIKNLEVKIASTYNDQTILSNLDIEAKVIQVQTDKLSQHSQKQQFIAREQEVVVNILLQTPVIFKLTYQETNFFLSIIKQIQSDSLVPSTSVPESAVISPNLQSKEQTSCDNDILSGTLDIGGIIKSRNNDITIKDIQFQQLIQTGIIPAHLVFNQMIQNEQFSEIIVMVKNDVKLYLTLQNSFSISIIDDRQGYTLLFELKLNKLWFSAIIEHLAIPKKNKMYAQVAISLQFYSYHHQLCEWEPVAEQIDALINVQDFEQRNIVVDVPENVQINITPDIIYNVQTIMEIINSNYIKQTHLQNDIPFYQKLTDIEHKFIQLNNGQYLDIEEKENVRASLFKQYHIYNASISTIIILLKRSSGTSNSQVNEDVTYTIEPMQNCYFDIENDVKAFLSVQETNDNIIHFNEIRLQNIRYKELKLKDSTIYMQTSIIDRQKQITFRPRAMIKNSSWLNLVLSVDGIETSLNHDNVIYINKYGENVNIQLQLPETSSNDEAFSFGQLKSIPATCKIGENFFRIEQQTDESTLDIIIHPTYVLRNECIMPIIIDDQKILPLQQRSFYTNPEGDFIVNNMSDGEYSASDVKLASKPSSKAIRAAATATAVAAKEAKKEGNQQVNVIVAESEFIEMLPMYNQAKQQRDLHFLRYYQLKRSAINQFQHLFIIHHKCIIRNMLATEGNTDSETAIISIKNTSSKYKGKRPISLHVGERSVIQALPSDKLEISVDYRAPDDRIGVEDNDNGNSSYEFKFQGTKINIPVEKDGLSYVLSFNETKNKLTQVLTVLPRYVIKNKSGELLGLYFCETNQFERQAHYLPIDVSKQPKSCIFQGKYVFLQIQGQMSSAIPLGQQGRYSLEEFGVSIHIKQSKEMSFITIEKEITPPILVKNNTKSEVVIKQKFLLTDMKRYKKQNIAPSIPEHRNKPLKLQPNQEDGFYISDHSIPQFITVRYKKHEIPINTQLMGRRKPYKIESDGSENYLFVRVYCNADQIIVQLSDKPLQEFLEKEVNDTGDMVALETFSVLVKEIEISVFQTRGDVELTEQQVLALQNQGKGSQNDENPDAAPETQNQPPSAAGDAKNSKNVTKKNKFIQKVVKNATVEVFALKIETLHIQNINFTNSNFKTLSVEKVSLQNVLKQRDFDYIFQLIPDKTPNAVQLLVEKENGVSQRVFKNVQFTLGHAFINIDQSFYDTMQLLLLQYITKTTVQTFVYDESLSTIYVNKELMPSYPKFPQDNQNAERFLFIHFLQIDQINVTVTLQLTQLDRKFGILSTFFNIFGSSLLQLRDAQLNFRAFFNQNKLWFENQFINEVKKFYTLQGIQNLGNILKSSFIFGSLMSAARLQYSSLENVSAAKDASERLQKLGNFGRNTISSYFSVVSATTTMLTNVTQNLAFDHAAMARRNQQLRESRKSTGAAVANAFKAPTMAIGDAMTGLFAKPFMVGKEKGANEAMKAVGQGVAGVVAKPITGIIDFFSHLAIAAETGIRQKEDTARPQRIYLDGKILPLEKKTPTESKSPKQQQGK